MLTSDRKWNTHVFNIAAKSNRSLGLVKRSLHMCKTDAKFLAYASFVRSHLEYAWSSWDPYTEWNKHKLESVQHRAARFVARNYDCSKPGKAIVQELGWETLEQRRKEHSLKLMFKVERGQSGHKMSKYFEQKTVWITCQCRHNKFYVPPQSNTNTYLQSYFPRIIRKWNALPSELVNSNSLDSFSAGLARHFSYWVLDSSTWIDGTTVPLPS